MREGKRVGLLDPLLSQVDANQVVVESCPRRPTRNFPLDSNQSRSLSEEREGVRAYETIHEPIREVRSQPRDFDDPRDPSLVPPWRDDTFLVEIIIRYAVPRESQHFCHVLQTVPVY